jgi:16S rRNA (guanine527-N7)-methyltransferase
MLLPYLPFNAVVADVGSGAGLPLMPCLLVRPDLSGFLIESARRKAIFLSEVLKETGAKASVINKRFQEIEPPAVQFLCCRAIEKFEMLVPELVNWAPRSCTLLLFGGEGIGRSLDLLSLAFSSVLVPKSDQRYLYIASPC